MQNSNHVLLCAPRFLDTRVLRNLRFFRVALETSRKRERGSGRERLSLLDKYIENTYRAAEAKKMKTTPRRPLPFALFLSLIDSAARFINGLWH